MRPEVPAFWRRCRAKYGPVWYAQAPTGQIGGPRPEKVEHAFSAVFKRGTRVYAFETEAQRDAFVQTFALAHPCEDPLP